MKRTWILFLLVFLASCVSAPADLYGGASSSRMTAGAALQQAQWQEQMLTATAGAPIVHITETAAAMAIQATQAQSTSVAGVQTQMGAMTATAIWWTPTPNLDSTATVAALNSQSTAIANQAIRDNLQLAREQVMNEFWAKVPGYVFVIVVLLLLIGVMQFVRRNRYQAAKVDARGNVLPLLDIVEGSFTDMDRSPNHRGSVSNDVLVRVLTWWVEKKLGMPPQLPAVTTQRQDATTERDQMIDLATRGLPGSGPSDSKERQKLAGQQVMKQLTDSNLEKRFKVFDEGTSDLTVINGEVIEHLDRDWQEVKS